MNRAVSVHWVLGHGTCAGNDEADKLAKSATAEGTTVPAILIKVVIPLSIMRSVARSKAIKPEHDAFATSTTGQFTKQVDRALPGKHTLLLYNKLNRREAAILSQLRIGRARVNKYLSKIGVAESELCDDCQQIESIPDLLFTRRKWEQHRAHMQAEHGRRY